MTTFSKGWLAGVDPEALRVKIRKAPYDVLWARLKRRTAEVIAAARASQFNRGWSTLGWHSRTPMVMEAALIHRLEGDPAMLAWVEDCLSHIALRERAEPAAALLASTRMLILSHGELALAADLVRDSLAPASRDLLLGLVRDLWIDFRPGPAAVTGYSGGNNISLTQAIQAAYVAMTWGSEAGHPAAEEAIEDAVRHVRAYLRRGCDPGGFGYEGTGYSHSVFAFVYPFCQMLKQAGRVDLFATEPVLKRAVDATLSLVFPGAGAMVNISDSGLFWPLGLPWLLYTSRHYGDPLHMGLWHAYCGPADPVRPYGDASEWFAKTQDPEHLPVDQVCALLQAVLYWDAEAPCTPLARADRPTAVYSPGTEIVSLRTSWNPEAVFVNFLGAGRSHACLTHGHADAGHFSLFAHGEYLAIDTGRYNVDEDHHNTILVDGACFLPTGGWGNSLRGGRIRAFQRHALLDYACADMASQKNCVWADRHLLLVRLEGDDAYVVTIDNVNADNAGHSFWWQLHANPACRIEVEAPSAAHIVGKRARLDITFAAPSAEDFPKQPHQLGLVTDQAWWSWPYGRNTKDLARKLERTGISTTAVNRPRLLAKVEGLNGQLMSVMAPRRIDQAPLPVRVVTHKRVLRAEVESTGFTDTLLAALDHHCLDLPDVKGFTELALIRRFRDGRPPAVWTSSGEPLSLNDQDLL
jgi:hypothetical protein